MIMYKFVDACELKFIFLCKLPRCLAEYKGFKFKLIINAISTFCV